MTPASGAFWPRRERIRSPSWLLGGARAVTWCRLPPASLGEPTTKRVGAPSTCRGRTGNRRERPDEKQNREGRRQKDDNRERLGTKTQPRRPDKHRTEKGRTTTQTEKAGQNTRAAARPSQGGCLTYTFSRPRPPCGPAEDLVPASACRHCRQNEPVASCELMGIVQGQVPVPARTIVAGRPGGKLGPILASAQRSLLWRQTATWAGSGAGVRSRSVMLPVGHCSKGRRRRSRPGPMAVAA